MQRCRNTLKKIKLKLINKHARGLSVLLIYIITISLIFVGINFVLPNITTSVMDLANNIPGIYNSALDYLNNVEEES